MILLIKRDKSLLKEHRNSSDMKVFDEGEDWASIIYY